MDGAAERTLHGGGEMGALMRRTAWAATPLGPIEGWPQSLRTAVSIVLESRFPMYLAWGPEYVQIYNDGFRPILGATKHPAAMGNRASVTWGESWHIIGPMFDDVRRGHATGFEDWTIPLDRFGYLEECFFTFSYSPVRDESGDVAGVHVTVSETTGRVLSGRRLRTLHELAERTSAAPEPDQAYRLAADALSGAPADVPFALFYALEGDAGRLVSSFGVQAGTAAAPERIQLADTDAVWPLGRAAALSEALVLESPGGLPGGPWPEPARAAVAMPIARPGTERPYGILVAGVSPRRQLDRDYREFFSLVARHVATAVGNARALEEERQRARQLAELDRAKTAFFSNISHEFRTPLTLLLGPAEDALLAPLDPVDRERWELVRRNGGRLLRLVNTLLDFARIEAGRIEASYVPVDLAARTREVASMFASAVERAGLKLVLEVAPLDQPVFVDPEMWEKIVLNLLSNALKFTFEGTITVALEQSEGSAVLEVRDTGTGIDPAELPRVFERFHRVRGSRARTHEGSGIGLSLVQELARLHGGTATAQSELGRGSTFRVSVPLGQAHLPAEHVVARKDSPRPGAIAAPYVEEAVRWVEPLRLPVESFDRVAAHGRVLLADDNADMREYVVRLLRDRWQVETASDGRSALARIREDPPDLLITDVMMPVLDGFGLLAELRRDPATRNLPVILLSARAGEEAAAEGLAAGANDYLVKPFSARELLMRVSGQLAAAQAAAEERRQRERTDEFLAMLGHELRNPLAPISAALELMKLKPPPHERERAVIERQIGHLVRLVNDLLDVSRITRGKVELRKQRMELADAVAQGLETSAPLIEQRGHALHVQVPRGLTVDADAVRLAQVVANLVSNSAKYTERDGTIWVSAQRHGDQIELRVRDDGIGISQEILPQIFELFVQDRSAVDRSQGGLGLGLAIVRAIVQLHGGSVSAQSGGRGKGSEFVVRIPAAEVAAVTPPAPRRGMAPPSERRRVLVVDDNEDAASLLADSLILRGHETRVAFDGAGALRLAAEFHPDVALLDLGLPKMDGFELARRLRASAEQGQLRLVALTGYGQESDRKRSHEAGFDAHLVKPVELDDLDRLLGTLS